MKQKYTQADVAILSFEDRDIIVTSNEHPNETPKWPIGGTSGNYDPYSTI